MIFYIFFYFFPYIHGDCLEFTTNQTINECLIIESTNDILDDFNHYYSQCLQCKIESFLQSSNIKYEENHQCFELQCIQLIFNTKIIFENFFQFNQILISNLFFKLNGTDQNTLHIIIKQENIFDELNLEYIENLFQFKSQSYRVLLLELYIKNKIFHINSNLIYLKYLSLKIILICNHMQTIYTISNQKIILESKKNFCSSIITSSTNEILSISDKKSKDIILIMILLSSLFLCLLIIFIICCLKRKLFKKTKTNDVSISQDISIETPLTFNEKPVLIKKSLGGMRAIQLLDDDI